MPLWIVVEAAALKTFVAVSKGPFDDVVKRAIVKVELERDGIVEPHIFAVRAPFLTRPSPAQADLVSSEPEVEKEFPRRV